jgi:hypothetical protein
MVPFQEPHEAGRTVFGRARASARLCDVDCLLLKAQCKQDIVSADIPAHFRPLSILWRLNSSIT